MPLPDWQQVGATIKRLPDAFHPLSETLMQLSELNLVPRQPHSEFYGQQLSAPQVRKGLLKVDLQLLYQENRVVRILNNTRMNMVSAGRIALEQKPLVLASRPPITAVIRRGDLRWIEELMNDSINLVASPPDRILDRPGHLFPLQALSPPFAPTLIETLPDGEPDGPDD